MGEFSWIYSDTKKQLVNFEMADTYLLVPPAFQKKYGKAIHETCYEGYGRFGRYDVCELIAEWNKEMIPEIIERIKSGSWKCSASEQDIKDLQAYYDGTKTDCELRRLGIIMACYDEDNAALKYPIKITTKQMNYDRVSPSESDPKQGWESETWDVWAYDEDWE